MPGGILPYPISCHTPTYHILYQLYQSTPSGGGGPIYAQLSSSSNAYPLTSDIFSHSAPRSYSSSNFTSLYCGFTAVSPDHPCGCFTNHTVKDTKTFNQTGPSLPDRFHSSCKSSNSFLCKKISLVFRLVSYNLLLYKKPHPF